MKLTKMWLITNATDTSFSRGRGYESSVRKLKKEGNIYTAKVEGSEAYKVEIVESISGIEADCTCPYDYEGICKHIVAVGLNILSGNFKEVKTAEIVEQPAHPIQNEEPINAATFYEQEFKKAKKDKQEAFLKLLFTQDTTVCRQFLTYIRPPAPPPLSNSTDIEELSNEIAARIMNIDIEEYLSDEEDEEDYYDKRRGRYDYDEYDEDRYDTEALENEVLRLIQPYAEKAVQALRVGQSLDSLRVLLGIYEAIFLIEEPELDESTDFSYGYILNNFFIATSAEWMLKTAEKTIAKSDYEAMFKLLLERWQKFKRFQTKEELAPYESLDEDLFFFVVQKAQAEQVFLDLMTANKLHTSMHYELTKKLCTALNKPDFLLEQLAGYGLDNENFAKELMQQYIDRNDRARFVEIAQKACAQYSWRVNEFVADKVLPTDNLAFFKKIVSEVASSQKRLDLYHRWREQVTPTEGEAYIDLQKVNSQHFYIKILADAKRFSDVLIFAEQNVENLHSEIFATAARLVLNIYPNEIFPLYCERIVLYMGKGAATIRSQYQNAVAILKPVKEIKGKEQEIKAFAAELRKMYNRLPAFLDELKKGGF
jgi:hypothetical protein